MAALAILRQPNVATGLTLERTLAVFDKQGFQRPMIADVGSTVVLWFDSPNSSARPSNWISFEEGFVACVGDLGYLGKRGTSALEALWRDFTKPDALTLGDLYGNFQVVISNSSGTWLFGDELGLIQLFASHDGDFVSTAWLSCLLLEQRPTIDKVGAQDYVLNGAAHSHRTVVTGISMLPGGYQLDLVNDADARLTPDRWLNQFHFSSQEQAVDSVADTLSSRTSRFLAGDPAGLVTALSGGYDSRLILAALTSASLSADLFVYGRPDDEDVLIAQDLARAIDQPIEVIDKSTIDAAQQPIGLDQVESNAEFFDGTPIDGLYDKGSDRLTRTRHAASGKLQLNGGGGEIFRNFFYLGKRSYSCTELVQCFYHQFTRDVFPTRSSYDDYIDSMASGISQSVGNASGVLTRSEVEAVYPLFRLRFWTSRTNSIVARHGRYYTPLVDPVLVKMALALPLSWKNFGRFEALVINRLDPALGARPMSYGFAPAAGPPILYRLKMSLQHARAPRLRSYTATLKRALGKSDLMPAPPSLLEVMQSIDKIVRVDRLQTGAQVVRARSLAALIQIYGIRQP